MSCCLRSWAEVLLGIMTLQRWIARQLIAEHAQSVSRVSFSPFESRFMDLSSALSFFSFILNFFFRSFRVECRCCELLLKVYHKASLLFDQTLCLRIKQTWEVMGSQIIVPIPAMPKCSCCDVVCVCVSKEIASLSL